MKKSFLFLAAIMTIMAACTKNEVDINVTETEPENSSESMPEYLNPNYVHIDWTKADVVSYDPENGSFAIKMNGEIPEISDGSVLTIDADTTGCVCIVNTCSVTDDIVTVNGTVGSLYDVFGNTELILATEELPAEVMTKAGAGDVIIGVPTAIISKNESGENEIHELVDTKAYHNILDWDYTKYCSVSYGALSMYAQASLSFDLGLYLDIQFKTWSVMPKYVKMYVDGYAQVSQSCGITLSYKYSKSLERNLGTINLPTIRFMVGYVPVFITVGADIMLELSAEASASASLTTGFSDALNVRCGFEWNNGNIYPINSCSNRCSVTYPTLSGSANLSAKAYLYPSFYMKLYSILGPKFDIMPYLGASVSKTWNQPWNAVLALGVDMRAGISILDTSYNTNSVNVFEKTYSFTIQ